MDDTPKDMVEPVVAETDVGRGPVIQRNGSEYLVTINGGVFLALSLAQAKTIANRTGRMRPDRD